MRMLERLPQHTPWSFTAAYQYLESFIDYEKKRDVVYHPRTFNLVRMKRLLSSLGDPHHRVPVIHIGGSKGKGSTAAMIHRVLSVAGYRTGLFTSPHLISPRERIRIGDTLISEDSFAEIIERLMPLLEAMRREDLPPTFFEIYTAMAFLYFDEQDVDLAVLEVGLGGRLDATNVVEHPEICVITPVSLDHTHLLGNTCVAIAKEKAGIIKPGRPVVIAPQLAEVDQVLRQICEEREAPIFNVLDEAQMQPESRAGDVHQRFSLTTRRNTYPNLTLTLLGAHQRINAATAVIALEQLAKFPVTKDSISQGLSSVDWPGRLQILRRSPTFVVDGAHSPAAAQALRRAIEEHVPHRRCILILGISQDKDIAGIVQELAPLADEVILTRASRMPRAAAAEDIADGWPAGRGLPQISASIRDALALAYELAETDDLICVTGSLYLVGETLQLLGYSPERGNPAASVSFQHRAL